MKNIVLIISFLLTMGSCKAQLSPVIAVGDYNSYLDTHGDIPNHTYFKDINHVLDKYVGTWVGTYDDNTYKFEITKKIGVNVSAPNRSLKYDELLIRFKITDSSGEVLRNTMNLPDNDSDIIEGMIFEDYDSKVYSASYVSDNTGCGDAGLLYFEIANSSETQIYLYVNPDHTLYDDEECPEGYIKPPFPDDTETPMTLTKQ